MAKDKKMTTPLERDLILKLQQDPILAAKVLIVRNGRPLKLVPHQRIILKSLWEIRPFNLMVLGRGMSKTFLMALYFTLRATLFPDEAFGIVSASFRQSKMVFGEIERFYNESPYIRQACVKAPARAPEECSLLFNNRSKIYGIPIGDGILFA